MSVATVCVAGYAAAVATVSLGWQVWRASRPARPSLTVTGSVSVEFTTGRALSGFVDWWKSDTEELLVGSGLQIGAHIVNAGTQPIYLDKVWVRQRLTTKTLAWQFDVDSRNPLDVGQPLDLTLEGQRAEDFDPRRASYVIVDVTTGQQFESVNFAGDKVLVSMPMHSIEVDPGKLFVAPGAD